MVAPVSDRRAKPRIATAVMVKSALTMFWTRLGSLNALALTAPAKSGKEWIGGPLCSADSMGRIAAGLDAPALRHGIHHISDRLKRNKALPDMGGLAVAVLDGQQQTPQTSDWIWVTTLSLLPARTTLVVALGHQRWDIENYGFHELVNGWHADHVYRHDPNASECFPLLALLAYNTFHAFIALHLKPQLRVGKTEVYWARLMAAEIYSELDCSIAGSSP